MSAPTQETRLSRLETAVASLTEGLTKFVDETRTYRAEQGQEFRRVYDAMEKGRSRITWPLIVSIGGFVLTLVSTAAVIGHAFMESRVKQLEIREEFMQRDLERHERAMEKLAAD